MNMIDHSYSELFDNAVLVWGLIACGCAQVLKLVIDLTINRRWRPEILFQTGGMPSSHSSLVTGIASGVGYEMGFEHPFFAIAATFALVVMYDASGIRRSAGLIAARVNLLSPNSWIVPPDHSLKETLGHTRLEVLIGGLLGPVIALPGIALIGSPLHVAKSFGLFLG